jgi:hypothetical protein
MKVTLSLKDESLKTPDMPDDPGWFKKNTFFSPKKFPKFPVLDLRQQSF